jgi:hypothetical protein
MDTTRQDSVDKIKVSEHCISVVAYISAMTGEEYDSFSCMKAVQFDWTTANGLNIMLEEKTKGILIRLWYDEENYENHLIIWKQIYSIIGFCQYHRIKWVAP